MGELRTAKATEARIKKGKELSEGILMILEKYPHGLTLYQISKLYRSTPGAILGAIKRVSTKVITKEVEKNNKKIKLYFIKETKSDEKRHPGLIQIPKEQINQKLWKHNAIAYAVSTDTIEITPIERSQLRKFLNATVLLKETQDIIEFVLPQSFIDFYDLENNQKQLKIENDSIFIHITKEQISIPLITKKRILIIDDENNQIIKNIKDVLKRSHKVGEVDNLEDAIKRIKNDKPDFVVLDWTLKDSPKEHQKILDLLTTINKKARAIIITAHPYEREEVNREIRKGFSWFYSKFTPDLPNEILRKMSELLE